MQFVSYRPHRPPKMTPFLSLSCFSVCSLFASSLICFPFYTLLLLLSCSFACLLSFLVSCLISCLVSCILTKLFADLFTCLFAFLFAFLFAWGWMGFRWGKFIAHLKRRLFVNPLKDFLIYSNFLPSTPSAVKSILGLSWPSPILNLWENSSMGFLNFIIESQNLQT